MAGGAAEAQWQNNAEVPQGGTGFILFRDISEMQFYKYEKCAQDAEGTIVFLIDLVEKWQYTKHKWFKMYTFWHSEINTISSGYVVNQTLHSRFFCVYQKV